MGKKIAYVSAGLLALFAMIILIAMCCYLKEPFKSFPGATMTGPSNYKDRPFGFPFDSTQPQKLQNQHYQQFKSTDFKGTSLNTIDSLTTGRFPISIDWGKNWYNVP